MNSVANNHNPLDKTEILCAHYRSVCEDIGYDPKKRESLEEWKETDAYRRGFRAKICAR